MTIWRTPRIGYRRINGSEVGLWRLDNDGLVSVEGNSHTLTDAGTAVTYVQYKGRTWARFQGAEYLTRNDAAFPTLGDWTIDFLAFFGSDIAADGTIVACGDVANQPADAANTNYRVQLSTGERIQTQHTYSAASTLQEWVGDPQIDRPWMSDPIHVAVVHDATADTHTIYHNGIAMRASGAYPNPPTGGANGIFSIGANADGSAALDEALLCDVAFTDSKLTAAQILTLAQDTVGGQRRFWKEEQFGGG